MKFTAIVHAFSTARTEFHATTNSVYGRFVVPPFINQVDLAKIDHSMAIVGGRGCGKTTYVRYFSHWTQFDKSRSQLDPDALDCIIFYWKPDTAYCRSMSQSWLSEQNARMFFMTLSGLSLLEELMSSLDNIGFHKKELHEQLKSNSIFWDKIQLITKEPLKDIESVKRWIENNLYEVHSTVNFNDVSKLVQIDPKAMFQLLLPALISGCELLKETRFKVFVDEFENLAEYQQKIINNYRKHSDAFLSWNVAHKRFAIISSATDGDEKLQQPNDYRDYTIDDSFGENQEKFFYCELLLLSLLTTGLTCEIKNLDLTTLGDREKLDLRDDSQYRDAVKDLVAHMLPTPSQRELSKIAIEIPAVRNIILKRLRGIEGLSEEKIAILIDNYPDVSIATLAISSQKSFKAQDLLTYIDDDFSTKNPYSQRVQTYLFTALLNLNIGYSYITIPIYSGFDRFYHLSSSNIRHFMELCYSSFRLVEQRININSIEEFPEMAYFDMHNGAINASTTILKEIPSYTPKGLTLNSLVKRLGDIFQISQKGELQSEPEKAHFFIRHDFGDLPEKLADIIEQAKCWRVLIEYPATKDKNSDSSSGYEYQLNPIYAPYFGISYMKKRRMEFTEKEFEEICYGDSEVYEQIRLHHIKKSKVVPDATAAQKPLFE